MTTELNDFFKLLSSEKKEKKDNLKQKIVDEVSLKNLFSSLAEEKKKQKKINKLKLKKESEKLKSLESILFQEDELDKIKQSVQEANDLLLKQPEKKQPVLQEDIKEDKEILVEPVIQEEQFKEKVKEVKQDEILKSLSKISHSTGVDLREEKITDLDSLKKEFLRFKDLVSKQISSIGGGGIGDRPKTTIHSRDIIPETDNLYSLGSASKKFSNLFVSGSTINLGDTEIKESSGGIAVTDENDSLQEVALFAGTTRSGKPSQIGRRFPFFSASGGLSTKNTDFFFTADTPNKFVYSDTKTFTKADGSSNPDFSTGSDDGILFRF
tara:strand:+ start:89 stop:1063 length:975 start_codon:yes stop_codon:yes gene_type:complete